MSSITERAGWLGAWIRGFAKIGSAAVLAAILNNLNVDFSNTPVGDFSFIWELIKAFAPLLLVVSGLRDIGVRI